eukprot:GHVN01071490.1.p1 GENE.GHVN01071490.1~~GHVN01071490.1.p1  ORF type:complete len:319 (+),score=57.88 GHVN01071490.1:88-1044(+)
MTRSESTNPSADIEARELMKKAEKKCQGGLFSVFTGGPDYDEACRMYSLAANKFKMNKSWTDAADCLVRCAALQDKMGDKNAEANCYADAATLFKKYSTKDATRYYSKAIDIYASSGKFNQAGKLSRGIAEMCEEEGDEAGAMAHFKKAADYHEMDQHGKSQQSQCIIKYGEKTARLNKNYGEAIKIFEKEGEKALRNDLIQFGAKEHFLKAGILYLAKGDSTDCKIACDRYGALDPRFAGSREGKLYKSLVEALEQQDVEAFSTSIHEYNAISPIDAWKVHFLYETKTSMESSNVRSEAVGAEVAGCAETSADIDLT